MTAAAHRIPSPNEISSHLESLAGFISESPSPYHAVATATGSLLDVGHRRVDPSEEWPSDARRGVIRSGGALVAWSAPSSVPRAFRIVGAHTDSPNLRIRPRPDRTSAGIAQLGVEVYGSPILASWLDRDLGLSGRVGIDDGDRITMIEVRSDEPLLRVPHLAIHLDRAVNSEGLRIDPQQHLVPIWGTDLGTVPSFRRWLADQVGTDVDRILSWDVMTHDLTPPAILGVDRSMFAAPRLDNLLSCHSAIRAMAALEPEGVDDRGIASVVVLFDHEEVGSESATGAAGPLLSTVLERLVIGAGGTRDDLARALAASVCLSADCAHATHPNHPHRSEPEHPIRLDGGPVLKHNAMARYATDAPGAALLASIARANGLGLQEFVTRGDLPCGSTIGPVTSARLGITTVDAGIAQLSMHSARELCGTVDPLRFTVLCAAFLADSTSITADRP